MVKRSSTSSNSATPSSPTPNNMKMVLRIKPARNYRDEELYDEGSKPSSAKRSKFQSLKKKRKLIDSNKPKKPATAFFFFLEDFRKVYQEEHPEVKSMRDIKMRALLKQQRRWAPFVKKDDTVTTEIAILEESTVCLMISSLKSEEDRSSSGSTDKQVEQQVTLDESEAKSEDQPLQSESESESESEPSGSSLPVQKQQRLAREQSIKFPNRYGNEDEVGLSDLVPNSKVQHSLDLLNPGNI